MLQPVGERRGKERKFNSLAKDRNSILKSVNGPMDQWTMVDRMVKLRFPLSVMSCRLPLQL